MECDKLMWKEITIIEEDTKLEKIADLTNSQFSCWSDPKSVVNDSKDMLKRQLSSKRHPFRCFYYKDNDFELVTDFRYAKSVDMWEEIRYTVTWDVSDVSIDLDIALIKMGEIIKQFLTETGKKIFMKPMAYDDVPALMKYWYTPHLIDVYATVGVKATVINNGKYWELEVSFHLNTEGRQASRPADGGGV